MKTKGILAIVACIIVVGVGIVVYDLMTSGYAHYGTWYDTPEEALKHEEPNFDETPGMFTPKLILKTVHFSEYADMTYISEDDTLVSVTFVINDEGEYSVYGYSEEVYLDSPSYFLMNGNPEQFDFDCAEEYILFPYSQEDNTVYGWCYSGYAFTVNGKTPTKESFEFECQGKAWSIDYWQVDGISEDSDVYIEYVEEKTSNLK